MSGVRRRVLRPQAAEPAADPRMVARRARQRAKLIKEKAALKRWMTKLKRATNTVTALHQSVLRLELALGNS